MKYLGAVGVALLLTACGGGGSSDSSNSADDTIIVPGSSNGDTTGSSEWTEISRDEYVEFRTQPGVYTLNGSVASQFFDTSETDEFFEIDDNSTISIITKEQVLSSTENEYTVRECADSSEDDNSDEWFLLPTKTHTNDYLYEDDTAYCTNASYHFYKNESSYRQTKECNGVEVMEQVATLSTREMFTPTQSATAVVGNGVTHEVPNGCSTLMTVQNSSGVFDMVMLETAGLDIGGNETRIRLMSYNAQPGVSSSLAQFVLVDVGTESYAAVDGHINFNSITDTSASGTYNFDGILPHRGSVSGLFSTQF